MKRILGIILTICVLLSILPTNVFAATMISKSDITVNAPEAGVAPIAFASVFNQSLEVVNVEWVGELDGYKITLLSNLYFPFSFKWRV